LNYSSCDSKVEHPKGLKLGFNSMFQILKLVFQKGWHYDGPLKSKDITKFHTQQTQNLKTYVSRSKSNIQSSVTKRRGTRTNPRHRTHTGIRPTPLATTTAFLLGWSPSEALLVLLQYNTTFPKHTSYSSETASLPRQCAIRLMTLRPDLSSCSYTTKWQDRCKIEPSKQLFDLYYMPNTPTAQASMLLGLSWSELLFLDSEARVRQLQIAAEEKNNADRLRTLTKLLFFLFFFFLSFFSILLLSV
jgi:hypothetical protein